MSQTFTIFRREFAGYFATPVAYVFLVIFLVFAATLTFQLGNFFERGQADLASFFMWHPWLYLFLIPAISMRLWSEERKQGTIELFLTLPIGLGQAVLGKFLAAWAFTGVALVLTFPIWVTVNWLGTPDNGVILAGYAGSLLMAGGILAGFVTSFLTAAVELSTTLMLVSATSDAPVSYGIYLYMQSIAGRGPGAALGVVAVVLVAIGTYLSHRIVHGRATRLEVQHALKDH